MGKLPGPTLREQARLAPMLLRRPYEAMLEVRRRHGPLATFGAGPMRNVLMLGREANELLLSSQASNFTWRGATKFLIPVDGDTALVVSDGDDHRRRRRLVQPAFSVKRIESYVPVILEEAGSTIARWTVGDRVDAYDALRSCVRRAVIRSLFGERLTVRADEIGDHLQVALDYINRPLPLRIDRDIPGTGFGKAMRARGMVDEIVFAEIAARRASGAVAGNDVLSALIAAQDDEGGPDLTDEEVRDQVISLIAAGYETTAAGVGWLVHAVYNRADVLARVREEVTGVAELTAVALGDMPYLDAVVSEVLRLWPPGPIAGRQAVEDFSFAGHTVPAGSLVFYSAFVTQRLAEHFPDPERFDPGRWLGGAQPEPYTFVPFGGGYRRCIGFALATLEMKATIAEVVRRVDLVVDPATPALSGIASLVPKGGVPAIVSAVR